MLHIVWHLCGNFKIEKKKLRIDKDRDYNLWKIVHTQNFKNIEEQSPSKTYNIITSSRV